MANTYTQLYVQLVFAVKGRKSLIPKEHKDEVEKYFTALIQEKGHKLLAIYCMPDHIHIFIGMNPDQSLSDLVEKAKTAVTKFVKKQSWMHTNFSWQRGYGAFSYSRSHIDNVVRYILNQEEHHKKESFQDEYIQILEKFKIQYDERYLFYFLDIE